MNATKDESTRLVVPTKAQKIGNSEIDVDNNRNKHDGKQQQVCRWKVIAIAVSMVLLVAFVAIIEIIKDVIGPMRWTARNSRKCKFCDQSPPQLHHDKSYIIKGAGLSQGPKGGKIMATTSS